MKCILALVLAAAASGQQLDLSILDKLASKAKSSVNVTLDEDKLRFASAFLSEGDQNQAAAKGLVNGLKAINVRVFEFDTAGQFAPADLDVVRKQLSGPGWSKIVDVKDAGGATAEVYMFAKGKDLGGLTVIAGEKKELTVVNIVGPIDLKTLGSLAGKFGVPKDILGGAVPKPPAPPKQDD
jgi:hypothetical protein